MKTELVFFVKPPNIFCIKYFDSWLTSRKEGECKTLAYKVIRHNLDYGLVIRHTIAVLKKLNSEKANVFFATLLGKENKLLFDFSL